MSSDFLTILGPTGQHLVGQLGSSGRSPQRGGSKILEGCHRLVSLALEKRFYAKHFLFKGHVI